MFTVVAAFVAPPAVPNSVPVMDVVYNQKLDLFLVGVDVLDPRPMKKIWMFTTPQDVVRFGAENGLVVSGLF